MKTSKVRKALRKQRAEKKKNLCNAVLFVLVATVIKKPDDDFYDQLFTFCSKIDGYVATLGLDTAKVANVKKDFKLYTYVLQSQDLFLTFSQAITAYKNLLRYGNGNEVLGSIPVPPSMPPLPPTVTAANMQKRFADLVQDCVRSANFTNDIGEDLGIIAPDTPFNPQDGKPEFKVRFSSGGHPLIVWKKGKFQGVNIYKNAGSGWLKLDFDDKPDYTDKSNLPATGQSAAWKYKLIYVFDDAEVGSFSEETAVTVYGSL